MILTSSSASSSNRNNQLQVKGKSVGSTTKENVILVQLAGLNIDVQNVVRRDTMLNCAIKQIRINPSKRKNKHKLIYSLLTCF